MTFPSQTMLLAGIRGFMFFEGEASRTPVQIAYHIWHAMSVQADIETSPAGAVTHQISDMEIERSTLRAGAKAAMSVIADGAPALVVSSVWKVMCEDAAYRFPPEIAARLQSANALGDDNVVEIVVAKAHRLDLLKCIEDTAAGMDASGGWDGSEHLRERLKQALSDYSVEGKDDVSWLVQDNACMFRLIKRATEEMEASGGWIGGKALFDDLMSTLQDYPHLAGPVEDASQPHL